MAELIDLGGGPVNPTEREIIRLLVKGLPKGWSVIPNASMPDRRTGHPYEYDAIVVGPHAVYVVEVKGWRGTIRQLGQSDWQLEGGRIERNPLPLADLKARVLASHLKDADLGGRAPYVQACLVCGADATVFEIFGTDARRCLRPSEIVPYLKDPAQLSARHEPDDHRVMHAQLVRAITGSLGARRQVGRRYGSYLTTELQERDDTRAVWLGRHALLPVDRPVRIRAWYLSAYQFTASQREAERARLMRAAEALSRVGEHPCIATLRDFGEHDGEFYEVTDWSEHGTLQTAFVRGALRRMPESHRIAIIRDVATALEAARQQGVFHRAMSPESVLLDADGRARLTNFDLAFVEGAQGTVYGKSPHPHAQFLPPELRDPADYDFFDNSDLYALAKMARFLFGDAWPQSVATLLDRCLADKPSDRPADPAAFLRALDGDLPPTPLPTPKPVRTDFAPGDVIDGVNIVLSELGRGAGAVVYRVANEPLGAELALKLVLSLPDGYDAAAEYRLLRSVESAHVPRAHWLGRLARPDGTSAPYLLLDLVDGERLSTRLTHGPVPLDDAFAWTDDVLEALSSLHAAGGTGVLHRDVKVDNVVIGPRGAVLVDFGSARESSSAGMAPEGTLRTTPPDLAETGWQPQADVFAAACIAYELLTGRPPWIGSPSPDAPPALANTLRPEVPEPVARVLARALSPRAADRFADAPALREALRDARVESPPPPAPSPRTTLAAAVEEAGDALWTARRVQALTRHADLAVPLAQALQACVVPPADDSPEAARNALLASEARAAALEAPLPEAMPRAYDLLLVGSAPAPFDASEEQALAAALLEAGNEDRALWFDALHFTEWALVRASAAAFGRQVEAWAWSAAPDQDVVSAFAHAPQANTVDLPAGDRASVDLGALMCIRRRALEDALLAALDRPSPLWLGAASGLVYLGHGLRRDVGEGLGDRADAARAAWAAAFPSGRSAPAGPALPCRVRQPLRETGRTRYPVGRLAWPDSPGTPWLQRGGLSLPERVLLLFRIAP